MVATTSSSRARMSSRTSTIGRLLQQEPHLADILAVRTAAQLAHERTIQVRPLKVSTAPIQFAARDPVGGEFGDAGKGTRPDAAHLHAAAAGQ